MKRPQNSSCDWVSESSHKAHTTCVSYSSAYEKQFNKADKSKKKKKKKRLNCILCTFHHRHVKCPVVFYLSWCVSVCVCVC